MCCVGYVKAEGGIERCTHCMISHSIISSDLMACKSAGVMFADVNLTVAMQTHNAPHLRLSTYDVSNPRTATTMEACCRETHSVA